MKLVIFLFFLTLGRAHRWIGHQKGNSCFSKFDGKCLQYVITSAENCTALWYFTLLFHCALNLSNPGNIKRYILLSHPKLQILVKIYKFLSNTKTWSTVRKKFQGVSFRDYYSLSPVSMDFFTTTQMLRIWIKRVRVMYFKPNCDQCWFYPFNVSA